MTAAPRHAPRGRLRVQAAPAEHFAWLEGRTGCVLSRNARAVEAVDGEGRVLGMVAFDGWTQNAAQAHMAVVAPLVWRSLLPESLGYVFGQAGRGLLLGVIPEDNARSVRMVRRVGFRLAHRVRDGWAVGVDLLCFELRPKWCRRWL